MKKNFYEILHISTTASSAEIKQAYQQLIDKLKQYPDRSRALQYAKVAQRAYRVLADPHLRNQYDHQLVEQRKHPQINWQKPNSKGKVSQTTAEDIASALQVWLHEDQKKIDLQKNAQKTLELFAQKKKRKK